MKADSKGSSVAEDAERELKVSIRPLNLDFWEYEGTRAMLEAEGVMSSDIDWPAGAQGLRWEAGRFRYWLRRCRPDGLKGPMKLWTTGDWWCLRCSLIDGPDEAARSILQKKADLAAEVYRHSPAGRREWDAKWKRYWATVEDKAFQTFKAKIPCLTPRTRGRKPAQPSAAGG